MRDATSRPRAFTRREGPGARSAGATRCRPSSPASCSRRPSSKLRFPVKKTMQVAQRLYEGIELGADGSVGLITYMRTDSTRVSRRRARRGARPDRPRPTARTTCPRSRTSTRAKKDAQDAHEAIRPTYLERDPESVKKYLSKDELRALQADLEPLRRLPDEARGLRRDRGRHRRPAALPPAREGLDPEVQGLPRRLRGDAGREAARRSPRTRPAGRPDEDRRPTTRRPSSLRSTEGDRLTLKKLDTDQHFTQPPPRFSEATLVKELEENGIGRPSTYASIIATIEARDYMEKREAKLYPTELGFLVTDLLVEHFQDIMNVEYTAAMEARARRDRGGQGQPPQHPQPVLEEVREGPEEGPKEMKDVKRMEEQTDEVCDKCGKPMVIKWGRYGKFLACSGYPECKNTRQIAGGEGDGAPGGPRGRGQGDLPEGRPADGAQEGPLRPLPRLQQLSRVQGHEAPGARRGRQAAGGAARRPSTRSLPRLRQATSCGAAGASAPSSPAATTPPASTSRRRKRKEIGLLCPECGQGQVVERKGRWGTLLLRLPPLSRVQVHRVPPARSPSPAPTAAVPTSWRRRPRRKARSSSAGTRRATTSAKPRSLPIHRAGPLA